MKTYAQFSFPQSPYPYQHQHQHQHQQLQNKKLNLLDLAQKITDLESKNRSAVNELREVIDELRMKGINYSRLNIIYTKLLS